MGQITHMGVEVNKNGDKNLIKRRNMKQSYFFNIKYEMIR